MELTAFLANYTVTMDSGNVTIPDSIRRSIPGNVLDTLDELGGKTFNHGIYRVYRGDQVIKYTQLISRQFAAIRGKAIAFAADWLGRQFIIDFSEQRDGEPTVVCLEPGVPDSFCTDEVVQNFHNVCLVEMGDAALAAPLFIQWRQQISADIAPDECVGYDVPLFLGGKDELSNLKMCDMEVYLDLCCQLWNKVKDLPSGSRIGKAIIDD